MILRLSQLSLTVLFCAASLSAPTAVLAQASQAKKDLAAKLVAQQKGPEFDRLMQQLVGTAVQPLIETWSPRLDAMPAAKQDKAREQLDGELKSVGASIGKIIEEQLKSSGQSVLLQGYLDKFSEEEMKQLIAMFESPTFRKYQTSSPELGNAWVKDTLEKSRDAVIEKHKAFDAKALTIVGSAPAAESGKKADAPKKK
jgi:uncharacterized protein